MLIFTVLVLSVWQAPTWAQTAETKTVNFAAGQIVVASGYKTERVVGEDFIVHYVLPESAQLNNTDVMLGIYSGAFPSYSPPRRGVKIKSGNFGDRRLTWRIWKVAAEGKTVYHYEALVPYEVAQRQNRKNKLKKPLPVLRTGVWHIFVAAPDPQRIRELMAILKSYRES